MFSLFSTTPFSRRYTKFSFHNSYADSGSFPTVYKICSNLFSILTANSGVFFERYIFFFNAKCSDITQQHFSVDVISISDGIYDSMIDSMLASGKPIEVPFKNYLSYTHTTGSMNVNMPFSISSQSIDRLWAIARNSNYNAAASKTANAAAGPGGTAGTNYSTLAHPYFNFSNRGGTDFQFTVNNTTYPSYSSVDARDWQKQLRGAIGDQGNMLSGCVPTSLKQYTDNYFAFAVSLEHHSGADERFVSGIDTRGASANCMFKSVDGGASGNHQIVVFAELTSILEIKANKVITVIQ
jgi:hypothetical protein